MRFLNNKKKNQKNEARFLDKLSRVKYNDTVSKKITLTGLSLFVNMVFGNFGNSYLKITSPNREYTSKPENIYFLFEKKNPITRTYEII